jgi:hypothetical protein
MLLVFFGERLLYHEDRPLLLLQSIIIEKIAQSLDILPTLRWEGGSTEAPAAIEKELFEYLALSS